LSTNNLTSPVNAKYSTFSIPIGAAAPIGIISKFSALTVVASKLLIKFKLK
jgi:hypothetical protein